MRNIEKKERSCTDKGDLVAYLYSECNSEERDRFEAHLLECTACTDEFAEMSFSRYSVFEWHRDQFVPMGTPAFVIPYKKARTALGGWGISSLVSLNWPSFAMAAVLLAAFGGFAFWIISTNGSGPRAVAATRASQHGIPSVGPSQGPPVDRILTDDPAIGSRSAQPAVQAVKASATVSKPKNVGGRIRSPRLNSDQAVISPQRINRRLSSLNAEVDDEDRSLRLTDLFEDLDG